MRSCSLILVMGLLFGFTAFSQQKTTEHIVAKGETISKIAKQYNIKASDIYELNPKAKNGIKFKSVLLIPSSTQNPIYSSSIPSTPTFKHEVLPKETIYGISKEYGVSLNDLYKENPTLELTGLKVGQQISILRENKMNKIIIQTEQLKDISSPVLDTNFKNLEKTEYEVLAKQTKYSIAKDFGITVSLLEILNPILQIQELKIGQKIIIPLKESIPNLVPEPKKEASNTTILTEEIKPTEVTISAQPNIILEDVKQTAGFEIEILPKQTKYSIAKQFAISIEELDHANPELESNPLKIGQKITIPSTQKEPVTVVESPKLLVEKNEIKTKYEEKTIAPIEKTPTSIEVLEKKTIVNKEIIHEVLPKETKYGIAKEHGLSISDLDKANPNLESDGLKTGQKIIIPTKENTEIVTEKENTSLNTQPLTINKGIEIKPTVENKIEEITVTHIVVAKETKYGIAKEFGITVKELERQNPKIIKKLNVGSLLTFRSPKVLNPTVVKQEFIGESMEGESNIKSYQGSAFIDQLISTASENIGVRYRSGGTTKDGFDCSGLMCTTFGAYDIQLPRTSIEQSHYGQVIEIENAQKGDLIFFKTRGGHQINHVGMVVEVIDGDVKFIHASNSGVIISSIKESYYSKKVAQVNRVL
ncbi:LysM peptidoglycan-binding domain-containing protein [Flavobacterium sp.]|uniref:peptidoglycan endopeptidase n=1 Tax=Flavobacterium sp. TaxID=239 RepID=UPI003C62A664